MKSKVFFGIFLLNLFSLFLFSNVEERVIEELKEMFIMDDGVLPEVKDIKEFLSLAVERGYIEEDVVRSLHLGVVGVKLVQPKNTFKKQKDAGAELAQALYKTPDLPKNLRSPDTVLYLTKEGNDIRLNWTGSGNLYDCAIARDVEFQEGVRTLFLDLNNTTYLYKNGLTNGVEFIAFDVTNEVEQNRGGNWNGGLLPPPPPVIDKDDPETNIGNLYIGSNGVIKGQNFSSIKEENLICFEDGVCIYPDTATQNRLEFKVPPGASSGGITVKVRDQVSEAEEAKVNLEDTAQGWTIRTMGYSRQSGEYWFAGMSGENSIFRIYYDSGTGKWVRENRRGGMSAQVLYCSTKTDSSGRLFCGYGTAGIGGGGTRYVETSPPGYLQNCINLGGSGETTNVRGVAVDGVRGFVYFAHYYSTAPYALYIKKVDTGCNGVIDSNYGNVTDGYWEDEVWNPMIGMVVDETNGDLYIASKTRILKIDLSENKSIVKEGFTSIMGIDLVRERAEEPGFLLIADAGAGAVKAIALDNLSSAPIDIAPAANSRTAIFGRKPGNNQEVISSDTMIYLGILHNNGNSGATSPVLSNKLIEVWPKEPAYIWISAPEGGREGAFPQGYVKRIYPSEPEKSTAKIRMKYKDNKERYTCARTGDPGKAASYDPNPPDPTKCDKPYRFVNAICDNKDNFSTGTYGVGSFVGTNNFTSCKICGSDTNPCNWEFWITSRYGGDNYKVYFQTADFPSLTYFARATPIYTAVKHIHIERDKMCRNGGILGLDAHVGDTKIYISKFYNQSTGQWERVDTINNGNFISIFDADRPYEWPHDKAYALITNDDYIITDGSNEWHYVEVTLKESVGGNDKQLECNYTASPMEGGPNYSWSFASGKSAGVCVEDGQFFIADASDLSQPFSDAFVTFHISKDGFEGSNVVPYLPKEWNDLEDIDYYYNFSKIWFKNFIPDTINPPLPKAHNYFHLIGAGNKGGETLALSIDFYDYTYVFSQSIEQFCIGNEWDCNRRVVDHEIGHHFWTNACTDLENCDNPGEHLGEHDYRPWWLYTGGDCHSENRCLMFPKINNPPGTTNRFCKEDLILGDPNCPNPTDKENTAIRTTYDPK